MTTSIRCIGGYRSLKLENIEDYPKYGWVNIAYNVWLCPYHREQLKAFVTSPPESPSGFRIEFQEGTQECKEGE